MKKLCVWIGILLLVPAAAFAATDEDYAELGIQMKGGISAEEAVAKAQGKTAVYHKAQNDLLSSLSGKKKEVSEPAKQATKSAPSKSSAPARSAVKPTDSILLKNGQMVTGVIDETDAKGVWIDMGGGVRTFIKNSEIAKAEKI